MSVVGIDFGTQNCTIAVAQRGGIDVLMNEVSRRQTPCMAAFTEKGRVIGEAALTQQQRNLKNTITGVKRFLGRTSNEPEVMKEIETFPYKVLTRDGKLFFEVNYNGEKREFSPVSIAAMILEKLKEITETNVKSKMKDVVMSVPPYWTDQQRRAMLDAMKVAGLNCLRLMNENTATALNYGIFKTNLSETDPVNVMFIDMGYSSTTVSIVEFVKGKLKVLSTAYDSNLGGRTFDAVLVDHFAKEFKEKYKIDILSNGRARVRLEAACEKLKKVLSSGPEGVLTVDSIMNDVDVKGNLKREDFAVLAEKELDRVVIPIQKALDDANLTIDQLASVEITGSATRLSILQNKIKTFMNRELSKTLVCEESVARGCALMCAILSPVFKVRDFSITDIQLYPIKLSWRNTGANDAMQIDEDQCEIFPFKNQVPNQKIITLYRKEGFDLIAEYSKPETLPEGSPTWIGKWTIPEIPSPSQDTPKLKVKVKLDINGIFAVENAQLVESIEVEETKEKKEKDEEMKDAEKEKNEEKKEESEDQTENAEKNATEQNNGEPKSPETEQPKKKKVKRTTLRVNEQSSALSQTEIQSLAEEEGKMMASDRLIVETAEKKNALESYVLDMRSKANDQLSAYITDQERTAFVDLCNKTEDWLYDEGEDQTKSVYVGKLEELKKLGDPMLKRKQEEEGRYPLLNNLKSKIEHYRMNATSEDPKYEHIESEEKTKVLNKCEEIEKQVQEKMAKQETMPKHKDPVITCAEIEQRIHDLDYFCIPIMNKPKPIPKKEEKPKENKEAKPENKEEQKEENKEENQEEKKEENAAEMDLD